MSQPLLGSIVALITPMYQQGRVDDGALERLVEFHIANQTAGIVAVGTTGESATLSQKEHIAVLEKIIKFVAGRMPVIAGTGANATAEAIELTSVAKDLGADYALLVTPYYNKPTQEGLYQHYKTIAEAVDIPQILYNVPGRTAVNLEVETVLRLSKISNIIGIKDATADLSVIKQLAKACSGDFLLYSGDDATAVEFIGLGGHGGISVSANVVPAKVAEVYQAALSGNIKKARELDQEIACLHRDLFVESNPIPVKWALHEMGMCQAGIRLPLTPLLSQYRTLIKNDLAKVL